MPHRTSARSSRTRDPGLVRIDRDTFLPEGVREHVAGTALFYPHSGRDLTTPVRMFAPFISDFWFCDWQYFGRARPADRARPVLPQGGEYHLIGTEIIGEPGADPEQRVDAKGKPYWWVEPGRLTETYEHRHSGQVFRVHRRRGFAYTAFTTEDVNLGVFFYRGDSSEGGGPKGGTLAGAWLTILNYHRAPRRFFGEVLDRLADGGLVVTDGVRMENERTKAVYGALSRFTSTGSSVTGRQALEASRPFEDQEGRTFTPVGYTTNRYGPTLAWQVARPRRARCRSRSM